MSIPAQFVFKTEGTPLDDVAMLEFLAIGATVVQAIQGKKVQPLVSTGVVLVTKENVNLPEAKNVLY